MKARKLSTVYFADQCKEGDYFCETYKVDELYHQTDLFGRPAENIDQFPVAKNFNEFPEEKSFQLLMEQVRWQQIMRLWWAHRKENGDGVERTSDAWLLLGGHCGHHHHLHHLVLRCNRAEEYNVFKFTSFQLMTEAFTSHKPGYMCVVWPRV